jgi:intracellular sulfur oxidation DsrE/DsrF family protein
VVGVAVVVEVKVDVAYETLVVESEVILEEEVIPEILEVEVIPEILAFASVVSPEMLVLFKVMLELMALAVLEVEVVVCSNTVSETAVVAEKLAKGVS